MTAGSYRKAIGAAVVGIPLWGAGATAEDGVSTGEWWGLASLLAAAFMVWWLPNDTADHAEHTHTAYREPVPRFRDTGQSGIVTVLVILILVVLLLRLV